MKIVNKVFVVILLGSVFVIQSCKNVKNTDLKSPAGNIIVNVINDDGVIKFSLTSKQKEILDESRLGFALDSLNLSEDIIITDVKYQHVKQTWKAVVHKNRVVLNEYNEMVLNCRKHDKFSVKFSIILRCYNDGLAFRYVLPQQKLLKEAVIKSDLTRLNFKGEYNFWAVNGERHNLGPLKSSETSSENVQTPLVINTFNNQYVAIHEGAISNFAPFYLNIDKFITFTSSSCKSKTPLQTSWRALIIGEKAGALIESNLLANLNPACKIKDTSWIKPGKSMWDWRVWGYTAADGFEYGLNTLSHKRFIDFAANNNIQYLLIDADWYGPEFSENANPVTAREGVKIEECMAYAKEKGVGVILYLNDVGARKFGLERVLQRFSQWGAAGIKYGFMRGTDQEKVKNTRKIVELCAKYRLIVDFHDHPIPPSGDWRTWPNLITREFCHAQADAKRSYFPETIVTAVYVNMLAGSLDMTNGWFDLNNAQNRKRVFVSIPGTVAAEVAKLIVIDSGLMVLPDSPEEYLKKDNLFDCIRKMPASFDSYKVLDGEIGEFIITARQAGDNWFIGSLTNREARILKIDFNFLPSNTNYRATLYEDAADTHYLENKEAYKIRKIMVNRDSVLSISLAPGGGHAIFLKKEKYDIL